MPASSARRHTVAKLEPVSRASANVRNNDSGLVEPIDAA
jgi:hypothetical protein